MLPSDFYFAHRLLGRMWRYLYRGILAFLFIMICSVTITVLWPRTYRSEARIYLRLGRETVSLDPTATTGQTVQLADSREREITSVLELLRSRALFEKVVDQLGVDSIVNEKRGVGYGGATDFSHLLTQFGAYLTERVASSSPTSSNTDDTQEADNSVKSMRERESAIRKLMDSVSCTSPRNSNVIVVSCSALSPLTAQQRLQQLLEFYQEQHLRVNRISGSLAFFDVQSEEKRRELDAKQTERRDAKNEVGIGSVERQHDLLAKEAVAITQSLLDAQADIAAAEARLKSLEQGIPSDELPSKSDPTTGASVDSINLMRSRLFELEIEHQRISAQYQSIHPKFKAIEEQLAQAKRLLRRQEVLVARARIVDLQMKIDAAGKQRRDVDSKLRALNQQEVRITDLDRQVTQLEVELRKIEENREQARTDEELTNQRISNINIAQAPTFSARPVSPNLGLSLVFGFLAACAGAIAVTFQGAVNHRTIDNSQDFDRQLATTSSNGPDPGHRFHVTFQIPRDQAT